MMESQFVDMCGNPITCSSAECVGYYNEVLTAFITTSGDLGTPLKRALDLDSEFILAKCLMGSLLCDPFSPKNPVVQEYLTSLDGLHSKGTDRERKHIEAFRAHSKGNLPQAMEIFNQITIEYPKDLHAARFAFGDQLTIGEFERMRDTMSRALFNCPKDSSLYPFVLSLYAFSLEETNERRLAEELCNESLSLNPINPWATHTMAHVIEDLHEASKGIDFLSSTRENWSSNGLTHHITWHLTLFYFDLSQFDNIFKEFDAVMEPQMKPQNLFQLLDAASLLWRLNVVGVDPGEKRWKVVTDAFKQRVGHPSHSWLETHLMMSLCHGKVSSDVSRLALARQVIKSMEDFSNDAVCSDCTIADVVGLPVCNALLAYGEEKYDEVLSLMLPLRYDFIKFGGSWAQRQVFEMTMIMGAINGKDWCHALSLITELKSRKPNSKLLQSLYETVLVKQSTETH